LLRLYLIALISSFLASLAATPVSMVLAHRLGAVDLLDARKIHTSIKPRWGGVGLLFGFFSALLVLWRMAPDFSKLLGFSQGILQRGKIIFTLNLGDQLAGILVGTGLLFVLGFLDDRRPVKAGIKFLIQIIAAYIAMIYGVRIYGLSIPGLEAYAHFPLFLMQIVTVLWLVGMTNAVNLIDGLDGLAGGVIAIVAGSFVAVALVQEKSLSPFYDHQIKLAGVIAASLLGGSVGFLVYNFNPARVFMGDCCSLTSGFLLGCIAVIGTFKTTILAVLVVPFILVAVPAADMAVAFGRRLLTNRNPFSPDRGHFHHRLLDAGWSQREVVLLVYVITLVLALVSVTVVGVKNS